MIIPDFLSDDVFQRVLSEADETEQMPAKERLDYAVGLDAETFATDPDVPLALERRIDIDDRFPAIAEHLRDNDTIHRIVADANRRPLITPITALLSWRRVDDPEARAARDHGEYMLHADTHYPTFKAWLYLTDVDDENGAMRFVPGSHRITWQRLRYEYEASVRVAYARRGGVDLPYGLMRELSQDQRAPLTERSICGAANTLVIANTSGFHRRGDFTSDRPRRVVHLNYRAVEAWKHRHERTPLSRFRD